MAAETFGIAASALAVVELSAKVVQKCTQYTQGVLGAKADIERVTGEVTGLGELAASIQQLSSKSPAELDTFQRLQRLLTQCQSRLTDVQAGLEPGKRQTTMTKLGLRALTWPLKSKNTEKIITDVHRLTQLLSDAMQVDQTAILLDIDQRAILEKLPVADGAPTIRMPTNTAHSWAENPSTQPVFWLNGMAGTGKSTISRTLAAAFKARGTLGATFFFKRGEGDRGKASRLLTTIAGQMIQVVPSMACHVQDALKADGTIVSKALQEQFDKLIKEPISKIPSSASSSNHCLIIVDALDECEQKEDIITLIRLFSKQRAGPVQLKFFLTSRPEIQARLGFSTVDGKYSKYILHKTAESQIKRDITAYFEHELAQIRLRFNQDTFETSRQLPTNWPATADLRDLVEMAIPLFIFASTVCRFIGDDRRGGPDQQLNRVLKYKSRSQESALDATYLPVLDQMVEGLALRDLELVTQRFHQIVGSIVTLADLLSVSALARLIAVPTETINDVLRMLHSVLDIPRSWQEPVRMFHLSFRDFLVNQERREGPFWIDEEDMHRQLARACLDILKRSPLIDVRVIEDPEIRRELMLYWDLVNTPVPLETIYACQYWVFHFQGSAASDSLAPQVWEFCTNHILQWIEAITWMGKLREGFDMLKTLHSVFTREIDYELLVLLEDSMRFIQAAYLQLNQVPTQTYALASAFSPINTINRDLPKKNLVEWAFMGRQRPLISDQHQQIHGKRTTSIKSITFSPSGELMSFVSTDSSVIICSASTGEHFQTLEEHSGMINAVSFSSDSRLIALASSDATITLWSVQSARRVQTLMGHSKSVDAVAFSPNGRFIVSKSALPQIILWAIDETGRWEMLQSLLLRGTNWNEPDTQNFLYSLDANDHWTLNRGMTGSRQGHMDGRCTLVHGGPEDAGLCYSADATMRTCSILSQTHNVTIFRSSDEGDQCRTIQPSAQIGTITCKPNGQLAALVFTNSTVILWAGHPAEILYATHASEAIGIPYDTPTSPANYPSYVTDTTKDRISLIAFSPDSSQVACIIR
ncbi:hypothetical protein G7054_g8043 [Neopestalotiopsis clavispora]|nr:hypothetical protein G7054_g8043 [Neopestalotiopsis clavispora]